MSSDNQITKEQLQALYTGETGLLLAEILDPPDFIALLENVGGLKRYIPAMGAKYTGKFAEILSLKGFHALTDCFGGDYLVFPKIDSVTRLRRNHDITRNPHNLSCSELARKYQLSQRQVEYIKQQNREA